MVTQIIDSNPRIQPFHDTTLHPLIFHLKNMIQHSSTYKTVDLNGSNDLLRPESDDADHIHFGERSGMCSLNQNDSLSTQHAMKFHNRNIHPIRASLAVFVLLLLSMRAFAQTAPPHHKTDFGFLATLEGTGLYYGKADGHTSRPRLGFGGDFAMRRSSGQHWSIAIGMAISWLSMQSQWDTRLRPFGSPPPCDQFPCIAVHEQASTWMVHTPVLLRFHVREPQSGLFFGFGPDFGLFFHGQYSRDEIDAMGNIRAYGAFFFGRTIDLAGELLLGYQLPIHGHSAISAELFSKFWTSGLFEHEASMVTAGCRVGFWL